MSWQLLPATALTGHAADWHALHAAGPASALLHLDFIAPLLDCFGEGNERLALYRDRSGVRVMALLAPRAPGVWATFQPAQAPLGIWLQHPDAALAPLLDSLVRALPGCALMLGLTQCDPLLMARPSGQARLRTLDYIDTARITLDRPFEDYWQERGKNLRANLKKQRARLDKEGVATRLEVLHDAAAMAGAVDDYGRLESSGWKAGAGTAVHGANAQGRFYRAMLEGFARRGAARVYRYWFDEQLVAMDLCIEDAEAIVVLKTSYDESAAAGGLSPTLLMREQACRALFGQARLRRIEFYGKVMEWHLRWTREVRTLYHINCYRWAPLAHLHAARGARSSRTPDPEQACTSTK